MTDSENAQAIQLIKKLAGINSGTLNKKGVDEVGALFVAELEKIGFVANRYVHKDNGDLWHVCSPKVKKGKPTVLISGHIDTVFEPESNFLHVTEDQTFLRGPGVNDMKGGLVVALHALRKLAQATELCNIGFVLSPDEEVGSPAHMARLKKIYKQYDYGLVLEGVGQKWELCHERKGVAQITLQTSGQAGHSGHWANRRDNAIERIAECIRAIVGLADIDKGTSVNVGYVRGGGKLNIVADHAEAGFDIRYLSEKEVDRIAAHMEHLQRQGGVKYQLQRRFPPMRPSKATQELMDIIQAAGQRIGRTITFESRGSASDGNGMADCGMAVIDGFGVKGFDHHTTKERMIKSSFARQTTLLYEVLRELIKD